MRRALWSAGGLLVVFVIGFSIWSVPRYPPLNIDEIGTCVITDYYARTGHIAYPLLLKVVHPDFSSLVSGGSLGFRAPYFSLLRLVQITFGTGYVAARALSVTVWVLLGIILFLLVRTNTDADTGILTIVLWALSPDAFMTSHLVREDIFITLFLLGAVFLLTNPRLVRHPLVWFAAGFLGPLAFLGFHPNGLYVVGAVGFLFLRRWRDLPSRRTALFSLAAGILAGTILCLALLDVEEYGLSRSSLAFSLYQERGSLWLDRLPPWHWLADCVLFFLRSKSFYFQTAQLGTIFWTSANLVAFFVFIFSVAEVFTAESAPPLIRDLAWLSVVGVLCLGLGAGRQEFIYRTLVTVTLVPVTAWAIRRTGPIVFSSLDRLKVIAAGAGFFVLIGVFRLNPIFFLLYFVIFLSWKGVRDRTVLWIAFASLGILQIVAIRDWNWSAALLQEAFSSFLRPVALSGGVAFFIVLVLSLRRMPKPLVAKTMVVFFLIGGTAYSSGGTMIQMARAAHASQSLNPSLSSMEKLMGTSEGTILGPSFLWFWAGDRLRDIGGILFDRYYSGQARPRACIDRVRPTFLVIDPEFISRYLVDRNRTSGELKLKSLASIVSAPTSYLGSLAATSQHGRLDVFRLNWSELDGTGRLTSRKGVK